MRKVFLFITLFLTSISVYSQTFDLQFVEVFNNGVNFDLKIQIRGSAPFKLGTSNIGFDFNNANLNPASLLTAHNFSGTFYNTITVTNPNAGVASVNIELFVTNSGTLVGTTWTDIATIRFPVSNSSGSSSFTFRTIGQNPVHIFLDDNFTELNAGTLFSLGAVALPVELTSFTGSLENKAITLNWETKTEINNYGFEIERAEKNCLTNVTGKFMTIGFVKGNVLSNSPKYYNFLDNNISPEKVYQYRLKQMDNGDHFNYSRIIEIGTLGMIKDFELAQNYPNPFNPTTSINYDLPSDCFVSLKVYDILGNEVITLVNEAQTAGTYSIKFNSSTNKINLTSGIYFYKISAGSFNSVRKMILAK